MSRLTPYRRTCPPSLEPTIELALASQYFVVQELGPMAMVVKAAAASATTTAVEPDPSVQEPKDEPTPPVNDDKFK
ncbi:hypothetical protein HKX48_000175, partial [Thoreauomyces humboldtii]